MRHFIQFMICGTATVAVSAAAFGVELTGVEIKDMLYGNTMYLDTTATSASGQVGHGVIYWAADGTALYKTANGSMMHGKSEIKGNTNCTEWKERPGTACTRYDKQGTTITIIDVASGKARATITKTAPGNPEKLVQ